MPDDKDQIPRPDEEQPEEKKYSFLQETIKPKPISRQQLMRQLGSSCGSLRGPRYTG